MLRCLLSSFVVCLPLLCAPPCHAEGSALVIEHGRYTVHLLLHTIGAEEYTITQTGPEDRVLTSTTTTSDRGMKRTNSTVLKMGAKASPQSFEETATNASGARETVSSMETRGASVLVQEAGESRTVRRPPVAFVGSGSMPASLQMLMMRYWRTHGRPLRLPLLRASVKAPPIEIRPVGHDAFSLHGQMLRLTRYTVANLIFGREILWMNDSGRVAALMTFAGGLPQEIVLDEYEDVSGDLLQSGVRQEMLDLDDLDREVPPEATGVFAIAGARMIDGTGAAAVENSVVVIRDGRIVAAGAAEKVKVPAGVRVIHAAGRSLLPGLWEMHTHYSGVEFGPALLAAGITTARDCGGERGFLTSVRRKIEKEHALGPRLLLAGLIDSGGPLAFGSVDVRTPEEGIAAVDVYADAGFEQIKVYTQIQPEVLKAISAEAHRRGLTVTGHVPAAMDAFEGIADGMDQINHLQFVIRAMNPDGGVGPVDLQSERSRRLIALLKEKGIVVDPTDSWGEMAGRPKDLDVSSFEPGVNAAPFPLALRYKAMGVPAAETAKFRERMDTNRKVLKALHEAGVTLVPGSDTGLIGYGLDRELELYVEAGMTPMEAIEAATLVSARVMKLDRDSGSIEVGKRADLVLVDGDPSRQIGDLRRVVSVVHDGRLYDSRKLARSVAFNR